ncbi:hypothetical protein [Porphyrobacter sp. MBR-49]|jgi:hypothetical protein
MSMTGALSQHCPLGYRVIGRSERLHHLQGHFIGRPLTAADLAALVSQPEPVAA